MRAVKASRRVLRVEPLEGRVLLTAHGFRALASHLHTRPAIVGPLSGGQLAQIRDVTQALPLGGAMHANIGGPADSDQFQLTIAESGRLTIWAKAAGASRLDSFLALYDEANGLLIQSDDVSPTDSSARIQQHLSPGTYRVRVSASPVAGKAEAFGDCDVSTEWQPASPPQKTIDVPGQPWAVTTGDFDHDGHLDLATANSMSDDVSILLGLGDGTFQQLATRYGVGSSPVAVRAWDLNNDGNLDLVVANRTSNDVSVLLGRGDGNFSAERRTELTTDPKAQLKSVFLEAADLNGDGFLDVVVANQNAKSISVLLGAGDGTLIAPRTYTTGKSPRGMAIDDFDGDGHLDLAVVTRGDNSVWLFLGNSDGTFSSGQTMVGVALSQVTIDQKGRSKLGNGGVSLVTADFNRDGRPDLATANDSAGTASVLFGKGDGTFAAAREYAVGRDCQFVLAADFNGDGWMDLATGNQDSDDVSILLNKGDGTFQEEFRVRVHCTVDELAAGDFNHDGRVDLAVVSREDKTIILLGKGDGAFQQDEEFTAGDDPEAVASGDFNGDGLLDLATANGRSNDVSVLLGRGDGTYRPQRRFAVGTAPHSIVAGDFNKDGRLDLATADEHDNTVSLLLGLGDGSFAPAKRFAVGDSPWSLVTGDFNKDGCADLATANRSSNDVSVLYGTGQGDFQTQKRFAVGQFPVEIIAGDFDGDGRLDLGTVNRLSHDVSVLHGRGGGEFLAERRSAAFPAGVRFDPATVPGWSR